MKPDRPEDHEPDYRMSLAIERTYLAYLRTGLALTAAGVAVAGALPNAGAVGLRRGLGICLVALSAVVFTFARHRFLSVARAMRNDEPLPPFRFEAVWTLALLAVALAAVVVVILA